MRRQARRRLGGGGGGGKTFGKEHGFGYGRNCLELQERGGVAAAALETTNMDGEISGLGEIRSQTEVNSEPHWTGESSTIRPLSDGSWRASEFNNR